MFNSYAKNYQRVEEDQFFLGIGPIYGNDPVSQFNPFNLPWFLKYHPFCRSNPINPPCVFVKFHAITIFLGHIPQNHQVFLVKFLKIDMFHNENP